MAEGRILVVKTGSTVPGVRARRGDFEGWIADGLGCAPADLDVASVYAGDPLPARDGIAGVVVTGSPAFVSEREPWSVRAGDWLGTAVEAGTPVLGICYGHQLLAQVFGGLVDKNPRGRSIGTVSIDLRRAVACGDALLGGLAETVDVHVTHIESVLSLPAGATLLGESATDPFHAFKVAECAWGVQFHPEFDAEILRGYVAERAADLRAEGVDPEALAREIHDTPTGTAVLRRFGEIALGPGAR